MKLSERVARLEKSIRSSEPAVRMHLLWQPDENGKTRVFGCPYPDGCPCGGSGAEWTTATDKAIWTYIHTRRYRGPRSERMPSSRGSG
jgi:hypothetical protein